MGLNKILNIAKNPILKYLSKFAKNLSPEHLKLSFIRGEGELTNLELDEAAIMSLLDLPSWLSLRSARCNRVSIKCQWTKLKKVPISLKLDKVCIEVEARDRPRNGDDAPDSSGSKDRQQDRYGFADKVIDGMEVFVNSVHIVFTAQVFTASIEMTKLQLYSVMANWVRGEMKFTYLRDRAHDQLLLFKEMIWETTRIEAWHADDAARSSPVRLVTNSSRVRIAIKKRLSDCRVLATKIQLLLDDLLWVLTVSQLEAAILFAKSLQACVLSADAQPKQSSVNNATTQNRQAQQHKHVNNKQDLNVDVLGPSERIFRQYDIHETSYHLHTGRIDLHFCEDSGSACRLSQNSVANGAIQLTLLKLSIDLHPLTVYDASTADQRLQCSESHRKAQDWARSQLNGSWILGKDPLLESATVIRLQDVCMTCVAAHGNNVKQPTFLASDKRRLQLPLNTLCSFVEIVQFCHADQMHTNAVPACIYIALNPLHLRADSDTILWLNAFAALLSKKLDSLPQEQIHSQQQQQQIRPLVFLEAKFPRLILTAKCERPDHPERPSCMELLANCLTLSNCSSESDQLASGAVADWLRNDEAADSEAGSQRIVFPHSDGDSDAKLVRDFAAAASDCSWQLHCQQLWCEFAGAKAFKPRQQIFLQPLPLLLLARRSAESLCWSLLLLAQSDTVRILMTHYQFLFIMRLAEDLAECQQRAEADRAAIAGAVSATDDEAVTLRLFASWRQLQLGVVLPALSEMRQLPSSPLPPSCRLGQPKQADRIRISDSVRCVQLESNDCEYPLTSSRPSASGLAAEAAQPFDSQLQLTPSLGQATFSSPFLGKLSNQFRGFGQRMVRAVGHGSTGNLSDTDAADWDKISMSSGVSSELERSEQLQFILEATREQPDSRAELSDRLSDPDAASAMEAPDSPISASSSSSRCRDTVSCLTVSLLSAVTSLSVQQKGSLVKIVARDLRLRESGNVNYEELLASDPPPAEAAADGASRLRLRAFLDTKRTDTCTADSLLQLRVCDIDLQLTMSSVANLVDFVEDELLYAMMPLRIEAERIQLQLQEDRPCNNLSCPGDHPTLRLSLPQLNLFRDVKEVFHLITDSSRRSSVREQENNSTLRTVQQENSKLHFLLAQCQDEIDYLRRERESLLKALNATQAELNRRPQQQQHRSFFAESRSPFYPSS